MNLPTPLKLALVLSLLISQSYSNAFFYKKPKHRDVLRTYNSGNTNQYLDKNGKIELLVWNMYKGKKDNWEADFKKLSANSQLLLTQEMFMKGKMNKVFGQFGDFEYTTATSFYVKKKYPTGVATIASAPSSSKRYFISRNKEPLIMTPKVTLINTYPLSNGESLLTINIHAINFVTNRILKRQLNDLAFYAKWHQGPVIFAGDFNTWTKKKQRTLRGIMNSLNLTEVKYKASTDHRMRFNGKVLDFIFYRGLELNSASVLGHINGSDHKPLIASFNIN